MTRRRVIFRKKPVFPILHPPLGNLVSPLELFRSICAWFMAIRPSKKIPLVEKNHKVCFIDIHPFHSTSIHPRHPFVNASITSKNTKPKPNQRHSSHGTIVHSQSATYCEKGEVPAAVPICIPFYGHLFSCHFILSPFRPFRIFAKELQEAVG